MKSSVQSTLILQVSFSSPSLSMLLNGHTGKPQNYLKFGQCLARTSFLNAVEDKEAGLYVPCDGLVVQQSLLSESRRRNFTLEP